MRKHLSVYATLLWAVCTGWLPASTRADDDLQPLSAIAVQYHGGRLIQSVHVVTVFWGDWWNQTGSQQDDQRSYMNAFFPDLFVDGRFMRNLSQYSVRRQSIGNGTFDKTNDTYTEPMTPSTQVSEPQIRDLLRYEIGVQHKVPVPDSNTLYFVFLPADVTFKDRSSTELGYHGSCALSTGKPEIVYAVIRYEAHAHPEVECPNPNPNPNPDTTMQCGSPHLTTSTVSHELAEAVTNPARLGWYYLNDSEEIGDIPNNLYEYGWITAGEHWDVFEGASGHHYLVEKVWSNKDSAPVAFR